MVGYYGFTLVVCVSVRPSVSRTSVWFSFPDDNLSKHQWIFTKLGMYIDIVAVWFGIANGQISSKFYRVICPRLLIFLFPDNNLSKHQWIFTKLAMCIDTVEIWFGLNFAFYAVAS